MNVQEFIQAWPLLTKQVGSLHLPWLDKMAAMDRDPFRVLISCMLSLRTQDRVTGAASERLFKIAPGAQELSSLSCADIEKTIYPAGFYRVKAKNIRTVSREISSTFQGKVPDTIDALLRLPGVGRKTANMVVTLGYDKPGICVDTHVHRITNRWGLVRTRTPVKTEFALREIVPPRYWKKMNGILVAFGQAICRPLSPICSRCSIASFCNRIKVSSSR